MHMDEDDKDTAQHAAKRSRHNTMVVTPSESGSSRRLCVLCTGLVTRDESLTPACLCKRNDGRSANAGTMTTMGHAILHAHHRLTK